MWMWTGSGTGSETLSWKLKQHLNQMFQTNSMDELKRDLFEIDGVT